MDSPVVEGPITAITLSFSRSLRTARHRLSFFALRILHDDLERVPLNAPGRIDPFLDHFYGVSLGFAQKRGPAGDAENGPHGIRLFLGQGSSRQESPAKERR